MTDTSKAVSDWHLPRHSWDTHVHVFEPAQYPYASTRAYTPETATYNQLLAFNSNLTITHTPQNLVLVQPSPYGTDNSLVIDLLKNHSTCSSKPQRELRAITVFNETQVTDEQLEEWNKLGVRGFRINTEASGSGVDYEHLKAKITGTAKRVKSYKNWKCQLFISGEDWDRECQHQC
jgi:predicted TIM-barrel fold metal-dependent hydrolase